MIFVTAFRRFLSALPRRVRFGEAVFRTVRKNLQEENAAQPSFSFQSPVFLGVRAARNGTAWGTGIP